MFLSRGEWHSRFPRETLFQDGDLQRSFSNLSLKIFDVLTGLSHFSPCICCIHNIYTSSKYISYILLYFLIKKSHLSSFWPLIFGFNLGVFFIFSPGLNMEMLPIHCQSASYISITQWTLDSWLILSQFSTLLCRCHLFNSILPLLCGWIQSCIDMRRLIVEK